MNAYKQYWFLAALLLSGLVCAVYFGAISWGMEKFPNPMTQAMFALIVVLFAWTFGRIGHRSARMIERNSRALDVLEQGALPASCEVLACLKKEAELRKEGIEHNQKDFAQLHERQISFLEDLFSEDTSLIDAMQLGMVAFGILFAILSIVIGLGIVKPPTSVETTGPYLLQLMQALGVAYVPAFACFASFIMLLALGSTLQFHIRRLCWRFDDASYSVAHFGAEPKDCLKKYDRADGGGHGVPQ